METQAPHNESQEEKSRPVTKAELKKAIKAFCLQCMGNQPGLVSTCPSVKSCPLWPVRKPGGPRWLVKADISDERRAEMAANFRERIGSGKA